VVKEGLASGAGITAESQVAHADLLKLQSVILYRKHLSEYAIEKASPWCHD